MEVGETWGCFQRTNDKGLKTSLPFPPDRFKRVSNEARIIVTECMQCHPKLRATAERVVEDPWCVKGLTAT
jgi:hypothetical protein